MYVTRTLSSLLASPEALSQPPPEGPCSGIAVILDEESIDEQTTCCWGSCTLPTSIKYLPFPQSTLIRISKWGGDESIGMSNTVLMIPVINQPLSSNTYYIVQAKGKYAGQVIPCSGEIRRDAQATPFDPNNIHHQVRIIKSNERGSSFHAESVACGGHGSVPFFMEKDNWETTIAASSPVNLPGKLNLAEGQGMCQRLRDQLPELGFELGVRSSDYEVVGRWYVPFIFVKEFGMRNKDQMRSSMYYKMSLEQRWERIFEAENVGGDLTEVEADVVVRSEVVRVGGETGFQRGGILVDGVVRFDSSSGGVRGIGLCVGVVERMKWEQQRGGWVDVGGGDVRVVEHVAGHLGWRRFGYYVLVERFVLRRMDNSLALSYEFYHTHQLKTKWE